MRAPRPALGARADPGDSRGGRQPRCLPSSGARRTRRTVRARSACAASPRRGPCSRRSPSSPPSTTPIRAGCWPAPIPWWRRPTRTGSGASPTTAPPERRRWRHCGRSPRAMPASSSRHAAANGGTAAASNLALSRATGSYVALLDHDDALMPHALHRVVEALNGGGRDADVLYSDEDKLELDGTRCDAYFKPDWSPDLFRSSMYACHLLVIRRSLIEQVGGFRSAFDFSQDYDLMLRVMEQTSRIHHIPDVLYHWRKVPESTALSGDRKPTAHGAGARALQDHLDRTGVAGEALDAGPCRSLPDEVPHHWNAIRVDRHADAGSARPSGPGARWRRSAASTAYPHVDLLLVSSSGSVPQLPKAHIRIRGLKADGDFRLPAWLNQGIRATEGEHVLVAARRCRAADARVAGGDAGTVDAAGRGCGGRQAVLRARLAAAHRAAGRRQRCVRPALPGVCAGDGGLLLGRELHSQLQRGERGVPDDPARGVGRRERIRRGAGRARRPIWITACASARRGCAWSSPPTRG